MNIVMVSALVVLIMWIVETIVFFAGYKRSLSS